MCRITVVIQPLSDDSVLEEASKVPRRGRGQGVGLSSYEEFEMTSGEPSPFSRRRAMFSTGKVVEKVSGEGGREWGVGGVEEGMGKGRREGESRGS